VDVSFRFYAQLNGFLDSGRRGRRFVHHLNGPASVKDAIEALGVPHPEVDVILVNGAAVDFQYQMREDDAVAVYPRFRRLDLTGVASRVGVAPPSPIRFVLDVHLGRLAALLRLSGFDTLLLEDDASIAARAAGGERIVLTRDVALLKRSVVRVGRWVRQTDPERQLVEVLEHFELVDRMQPFTRCLECNTPLVDANAITIETRVEPQIRRRFAEFRHCPGCDRVYWQGTHYLRLLELMKRVRTELLAPASPSPSPPSAGGNS
jgi:uncharacterized protein with PIN domain